jgi:hypothetical protein
MDNLTPPGHTARRIEGGLLIGRASGFSTGCAVMAREAAILPVVLNDTAGWS